jgi:6-phosphogluconolactonase (cycloisomerase 2 family)
MPSLSESSAGPRLRGISVSVATAVCLLLAGCGSSNSNPSPPSPPAPIGHAYVVTSNNLYAFQIAASNGGLAAVSVPAGAPGGTAIAADGQGNHVYTLTSGGQISGYDINRSDGSLTNVAGSPWGGAGIGVAFLAVSSAGTDLYVPAVQDLVVVPYTIDSMGALTIGLQVATPAAPVTATIDPPAHFLYVPMGSAGTQLFQIVGGALVSQMTIPPMGQGKALYAAINPADTFAYISDGVSGVAAYSINASTGELTPLAGSPFTAGVGPGALAITPNGNFLYVANTTAVVAFAINADGSLTSIGSPVSFSNPPVALSIDTTGAYLYILSVNSNRVAVYKIDANTGLLTQGPSVALPAMPTGIVTTP